MLGLKTFIPKEFRPFLKYIGPSAFEVIEWKKAIKPIGQISKRYFTKEGVETLITSYLDYQPSNLELTTKDLFGEKPSPSELGEMLLKIYFSQLENPEGTFLDLRHTNFAKKTEGLVWQPQGLWLKWEENFRIGLLDVYKGFYENQRELMQNGLEKMSLVKPDMSEATKKEILNLLVSHVGSDSPTSVNFELSKFEKSFEAFFSILKKEKIRLPADFLFLGLYLVSLYSSLEELGSSFNVEKAYFEKNQ